VKYRKKPVVIEAIKWDGNNLDKIRTFTYPSEPLETSNAISATPRFLEIVTLEGRMRANIGDWIIRGVKGEYYPCKPDIFEAIYEKVEP